MSKEIIVRPNVPLNHTTNLLENTSGVIKTIWEDDKDMELEVESMKMINGQSACIMDCYKNIYNDESATLEDKMQVVEKMQALKDNTVQTNQKIIKSRKIWKALYRGIAAGGAIILAAIITKNKK